MIKLAIAVIYAALSGACTILYAQNKTTLRYTNPIIHADYSDPDVIRVGENYYMTASSFNQVPGVPILHSKDLVHWKLIAHVFDRQRPFNRFDTVQHGGGFWAPSIRHHNKKFYIYYPDPDQGIWMVKAKNPLGPWTEPVLVKQASGWIDPCPFWDNDGKAYLVNGMAASRSGIKSTLILSRMSPDGTKLLDRGVIIYDGHAKNPTIEGPKLYRRNGYYYILAPAGGVGNGWQLALRSKHIYGPYEEKVVLEQGSTQVNGPHQGGLVNTSTGETWFMHFQDKDAYGRVVHLQPVTWKNDWPLIGFDFDKNGIGEPVPDFKMPNVGSRYVVNKDSYTDEFNGNTLSIQWQWAANPKTNWYFLAGKSYGFLRLYNVPVPDKQKNLWMVPNLLTQKFPSANFTAVTKFTFAPQTDDEETGIIITGIDYAYLSVKKMGNSLLLSQTICKDAENGGPERKSNTIKVNSKTLYFKVEVRNVGVKDENYNMLNTATASKWGNAGCTFSYSTDGVNYNKIGEEFAAKKGKWIGAKVGIFAIRNGKTYETGYADYDWFKVTTN